MNDQNQSIQTQPAPSIPSEEPSVLPPKPTVKVLLIEDDLSMVKMYTTRLEKENLEVEVATDGEEGLRKINEGLPDLIVLDLMIPKMGGMELLKQLRASPKTKDLPVIILSNLSQERDIENSRALGVRWFLIKANFTPSQVVEKIKECLRK